MITKNDKKKIITQIDTARFILSSKLQNESINDNDILSLFEESSDYGVTKIKNISNKEKLKKEIFNYPFLLCDQDCLSDSVKKSLQLFLKRRYNMELNELEYLLESGQISQDEYLDSKEMLKFCYYETSWDGKRMVERKKVKYK